MRLTFGADVEVIGGIDGGVISALVPLASSPLSEPNQPYTVLDSLLPQSESDDLEPGAFASA